MCIALYKCVGSFLALNCHTSTSQAASTVRFNTTRLRYFDNEFAFNGVFNVLPRQKSRSSAQDSQGRAATSDRHLSKAEEK